MITAMRDGYNQLVEAIIRPPRDVYTQSDLGPQRFRTGRLVWTRMDLELENPRGMSLKCSHFVPEHVDNNAQWPVVVYLHGNASSRVEAMSILEVVLPLPCTLFSLDFAGSGQ